MQVVSITLAAQHSVHPRKGVHYAQASSVKATGQGPGGGERKLLGGSKFRVQVVGSIMLFAQSETGEKTLPGSVKTAGRGSRRRGSPNC